ncbi:hypothetical protein BU15DRAFT_61857 [Melanogaster broomeanus]|nr:hypothetical protein BU15DRAFT_61857 [Melanogaster broomeanus]
MHLKTARELFQYLASLFETKKSDGTQREATCNPRTHAGTDQKCNQPSHKARDREAVKKAESAIVEEPRDVRCREPKHDARSHGRVEMRGREGKRAAGRTSEQGAAARGPGEAATDQGASGIGRAVMPSSQDDDSRDAGVHCTHVMPQEPQVASGRAGEATADARNPNVTSAGPAEPAGRSPKPQVEPHEIVSSDDARGEGREVNNRVDEGERRASEKVAAARGPGEDATDQGADGISLAASASSLRNETTARGAGESTTDQTADGVSLAVPGSSPNEHGVETSVDETTNVNMNETAAPPSLPFEGERDNQATSGNTRVHSEGAEPPDSTADAQDGTQAQRCTNGMRTAKDTAREQNSPAACTSGTAAQQVDASSPATRQPDPRAPLEGERGYQPSSGPTDDGTIARVHRAQLEDLQGNLGAEEDCQYKGRTRDHAPTPPSTQLEGEQGSRRTSGHADEVVHNPSTIKDVAAAQPCEGEQSPAAQVEGQRSPMVQIEREDDGTPPVQRRWEDRQREECTNRLQSGLAQPRRRGRELSNRQTKWHSSVTGTYTGVSHDPGGGICRRNQSSEDEGCTKGRSDRDGSGRDGGASGDDSATSSAGCESRRLVPKMLAEDEQSQHRAHIRTALNSPRPSPPLPNNTKRPTKPANPPRRRGRLKTRPRRVNRAPAHEETRTRAGYGHVGTVPGHSDPSGASDMHWECRGNSLGQPGPQTRYHERSTRRPRAPITRKRETRRGLPYRVTAQMERFEPRRGVVERQRINDEVPSEPEMHAQNGCADIRGKTSNSSYPVPLHNSRSMSHGVVRIIDEMGRAVNDTLELADAWLKV